MKVAILAGGLGTRLSEETAIKPKPMVEIGGMPMLWHIMKIYASQGYKEFVIALGYKGEIIKDFFINYLYRSRSISVRLKNGEIELLDGKGEDWVVHLLDTGANTNTGGRVKRISEFIGKETFMLTYGDGVSNVNIEKLIGFHQDKKKLATLTAVRPPARFGQMLIQNDMVVEFKEKPQLGEGWINGGFFVLEPGITEYIQGDETAWEYESLEHIAADKQLTAYLHDDFWLCMDTLRDVNNLEKLWQEGNAPWKLWN